MVYFAYVLPFCKLDFLYFLHASKTTPWGQFHNQPPSLLSTFAPPPGAIRCLGVLSDVGNALVPRGLEALPPLAPAGFRLRPYISAFLLRRCVCKLPPLLPHF